MAKAFGFHKLHRLEVNIQPENMCLIHLVQNNFFIKEGFSKNYLKIDGKWRNYEKWAITKELFMNGVKFL